MNMLIVRVFRVVGGICSILTLSKKYSDPSINKYIGYIILLISIIFFIYLITISTIKMYYRVVLWREGYFEIKN